MRNNKLRIGIIVFLVAIVFSMIPFTAAAEGERLNTFIEKLIAGKVPLGVISSVRDISMAGALADSEINWVFVDMEHPPFDTQMSREFLQSMLRQGERLHVTPILRIPAEGGDDWGVLWQIKQALDNGFYGVIVPHVDSAAEARRVVEAMRYPPFVDDPPEQKVVGGVRGYSPGIAVRYWNLPLMEYLRKADVWPLDPQGELACIIIIESIEAVNAIDSIVKVPGLTAIFFGPADFCASVGKNGAPTGYGMTPEVEWAAERILKAAEKTGVPVGITTTVTDVVERIKQGFKIVTIGSDVGITKGVSDCIARLKKELPGMLNPKETASVSSLANTETPVAQTSSETKSALMPAIMVAGSIIVGSFMLRRRNRQK